jgi:hypothetical protein
VKELRRVIHRNGVVEFDDPHTGRHMVMMDGLTVESSETDALAIVTLATVVACGSCFRRWIEPVEEYRNGWGSCRHCNARLFLPPLYLPTTAKVANSRRSPNARGDRPRAAAE